MEGSDRIPLFHQTTIKIFNMNIIEFINNAISNPETNWECDGQPENYQLTNYQLTYLPAHLVLVEEVCINQYGSRFGIGPYTIIDLPKEIPAPNWLGGWIIL